MDDHWIILVDLTTNAEPVSDLTLNARLYAEGNNFSLVVEAVYVP